MGFYIDKTEDLTTFFGQEYYNSINYVDYKSRIEKYQRTTLDFISYFGITNKDSILDYGCAMGLLLDGFHQQGISKLTGFDISEWAVNNSINPNLHLSTDFNILSNLYEYTFALDVFEHMFDSSIDDVLTLLNTKQLVVRLPVKVEGDEDFFLEVSRRDRSHVNCKTKGQWIDFIESRGYRFEATLTLDSVYDSKGCFCGYFIKA